MRAIRSVALAAAVLVLAGCGGSDQAATESSSSGPDTRAVPCDGNPPGGSLSDPLPRRLPEGRGVVVTEQGGTRTVRSAWGDVVVPDNPERIVSVIGDIDFESMLALGVQPVGAGTQGGTVASGFAPHLDGLTEGVTPLAWTDGIPVESILALDPDLVFVPDQETADQLGDIVPVVPSGSWDPTQWKDDFLYVGAVLGCQPEAEQRLAEYEQSAAELRQELAPVIEGKTVASPQVGPDQSQLIIPGIWQHSSVVLEELGFALDDLITEGDEWEIGLSLERLDELDADILFWQVRQDKDGNPDTEALSVATDNPLYATLPAVESDAVYQVPNRPWYFPTILGAEQILADVRQSLLS